MTQKPVIEKANESSTEFNSISISAEREVKLKAKPGLKRGPFSLPFKYSQTKVFRTRKNVFAANRVVAQNKEDPRGVAFQMLRSKVLSAMRLNNWNSLAISAPSPNSGKSLITVNLAMSIAQETNQTVLVVDMDLRRPSIHKYFGIKPVYGLSDFVKHGIPIEKILVNPGVERLVILPGRERLVDSAEVLSTQIVTNMVDELKQRYESRIIIFDLPPLLVSDDVMVFLPSVDCSLLVVESGGSTRKEIEDSIELLGSKPFLGTVLNKETDIKQNYIY